MVHRGQPDYTIQKVAEIAVVSLTYVRLSLECGYGYVYNPFLATGQSIEERAAQLQKEIGRTWRCKTCRPEHKPSKEEHA